MQFQTETLPFFDYWNDYLRREYVIAKGHLDPRETAKEIVQEALRTHGSQDLSGDLYYLRTAIVHKQGLATSSVAKCKLIKWFGPGELISITPDRMRAIFLGLLEYYTELHREQFPKPHIIIDF